MARVSNPLIGAASGSVGGVTMSTWKGVNVIKTKPTSVANPKTEGQTAQRAKLSTAVSVYKQMPSLVKKGFGQAAIKKSAYNAFVSTNTKANVFDKNSLGKVYNKNLFSIASGTLDRIESNDFTCMAGNKSWSTSWDTNLPNSYSDAEECLAVVVSADGSIVAVSDGQSTAGNGELLGQATVNFIGGQTYHLYLAFYQPSTRKATGTYHTTTIAS